MKYYYGNRMIQNSGKRKHVNRTRIQILLKEQGVQRNVKKTTLENAQHSHTQPMYISDNFC